MKNHQYIEKVVNLLDPDKNVIYNMSVEEATELLKTGDSEEVRKIDGQFSLVSVVAKSIKLTRSIGRPLRYFIAKLMAGPCLIIADRIDIIYNYLKEEGLDDQFHPSYTRMAPAHYITSIELLGCPDPNPIYDRYFTPQRNSFKSNDLDEIGRTYMSVLYDEIVKWLKFRAKKGPIGVTFSAGIDSGSVFLLTYHALRQLGESPSRLKAFTLSVNGAGEDLKQARSFMDKLGLPMFLEPIEVTSSELDWKKTVGVVEDYKALDIQSATMNMALLEGIRKKYPDWKYMLDGDGGDENLKDYPIEENPELTIKSVLNNLMLYQEGWGVHSMKHSLTYSGGLSRSFMRTFAPLDQYKFDGLSPYTSANVIEVAESIPFIEMTDWDHNKLYALKGQIVSAGIKAITGLNMPVYEKRRFQQGVAEKKVFEEHFPDSDISYRKVYQQVYD
jgi:asparagine synthase (glutamine-hydrolysing)